MALVGSSGVGKSTLVNTLAGADARRAAADRRHPRTRRQGAPHHDLALAARHRRRRLGDRHAGHAHAACQRRRRRHRDAVRRDHRTRAALPVPRLHPCARARLRGAGGRRRAARSTPSVWRAGASCTTKTATTRPTRAAHAEARRAAGAAGGAKAALPTSPASGNTRRQVVAEAAVAHLQFVGRPEIARSRTRGRHRPGIEVALVTGRARHRASSSGSLPPARAACSLRRRRRLPTPGSRGSQFSTWPCPSA